MDGWGYEQSIGINQILDVLSIDDAVWALILVMNRGDVCVDFLIYLRQSEELIFSDEYFEPKFKEFTQYLNDRPFWLYQSFIDILDYIMKHNYKYIYYQGGMKTLKAKLVELCEKAT